MSPPTVKGKFHGEFGRAHVVSAWPIVGCKYVMNSCKYHYSCAYFIFYCIFHKFLLHLKFCMMIEDDMSYLLFFYYNFSFTIKTYFKFDNMIKEW